MLKTLFSLILILSTNVFSQWEQVAFKGDWIYDIAVKENQIFAGSENQLYFSEDDGVNWDTLVTFGTRYIDIIKPINQSLFVGLSRGCFNVCPEIASIYKSTDNGFAWDSVHAARLGTRQIISNNGILFADSDEKLIRSSNDGNTWEIETSIGNQIVAIASNDRALFVSGYQDSLYRSLDTGTTWQSIENGLPNTTKWHIVTRNDTIFLNANSVYRSIDNGDTWEIADTGLPSGVSLSNIFLEGQYLYASSFDNKIFMTKTNNINWADISEGLIVTGNANITDITITDEYIFASANTGIWRRHISQIVSLDNLDLKILPEIHFNLKQNYPNPFNPNTFIEYNIFKPCIVTISVYNILGEVTEILDEGFKNIGEYKIKFDGTNYPSGIYFYKLSKGEISVSKSMLLIR